VREDTLSDGRSVCEHHRVANAPFEIRPARVEDRLPLAVLFAAVAEERDGIAAEPPVDVKGRAEAFDLGATMVATATGEIIGGIWIIGPFFGAGEIAMLVARSWRGRGVGSALLEAGSNGEALTNRTSSH
jgi:GNAT superfamily N-acetyltransferase